MKVLLADDEAIARTMLEHWLRGWGYQVTCVTDGVAATEALAADPELRLAILDWVMPRKDGLDVCQTIRSGSQEPYVYTILLTARDNKDDIVRGLDAGADDYLIKPCNPLELRVRLRAGRRVIELQEQLVQAREALRYEAMRDSLTTLLNRGALLAQLDRELARTHRGRLPLSLVMLDLDHFKAVNDRFGHFAGDAVLKEAARRFSEGIRAYDSLGRVGGEEFMLVLPDCTSDTAMTVASRLRVALAAGPIKAHSGSIDVTASLGVAGTDQSVGATLEDLIRTADSALYRAKAAGRNRVELATPADWAAGTTKMQSRSQPSPAA